MNIQQIGYAPAFKATFDKNNQGFKDVVDYAQENNCLRTLDCALNTLKKANPGTIRIYHGQTSDGNFYSNFSHKKRTVSNDTREFSSPAEASYYGILELSMLNRKFKSLIGTSKVQQNITPKTIMTEYTT